jgi:hypothetical protein
LSENEEADALPKPATPTNLRAQPEQSADGSEQLVKITVHTIDGPLEITITEHATEAEVKEAIRRSRNLAEETTTWLEMNEDHEEGRCKDGEQLQTLATVRIIARADAHDLTIWGAENAEPDDLLTLIREALLVQPTRQIWYHTGSE